MVDVCILDGGGSGKRARVSSSGQVATAPFAFDLTEFRELNATNTAFNFYPPVAGNQFVITVMRIKAARSVSNTVDARIIIYESNTETGTAAHRILHEEALIRGENATLNPTNILCSRGAWISARTNDATVFITIMGYYVPVVDASLITAQAGG